MTSLTANAPPPMRSPFSFMGSLCLHIWILAWVALGPSLSLERQKSLYEREIQPYEKHIVWYKFTDRLPDVTPPSAAHNAQPLRARSKFEQNIVVGPKDTDRPPQLIIAPAPEITPAKALPLPNIVAVAPERPPALPFTPPPVKPAAPSAAPLLPDAPDIKAPSLAMAPPRIVPRFNPPANPKLTLPAADPVSLPPAPEVSAGGTDVHANLSLPKQPAKFVPPEKRAPAPAGPATIAAPPPALSVSGSIRSEETLVIAGLNPSKSTEVPAPPGSVKSGFSGGPKPQPTGSEGAGSGAILEIPSLTVQGGAKNPQPPLMVASVSPTSPEGLGAALHSVRGTLPGAPPTRAAVPGARLPDPRFRGRQVYTMAVQIPNLTSYSGSWMVWFASRESDVGDASVEVHSPLPLHMVSARYVHTAEEDRVEGKVRLWAVIGKDGHVGEISVIEHLDDRLDQTAQEALAKWLFQPAVRNGVAIDVDAVFEIPFHLPPKTLKR